MGYFCNFRETGFYLSWVSDRVSNFFDKTRTWPRPISGFFFLNPYPTLFLIGLGKTRPIRVRPSQVPVGWAKIAIPTCDHVYIRCAYLWYIYIYIYDVCLLHLPLHVLFLFYLYTHVSYFLYAIYYFCFTLRCFDEFYLKCYRNTGCQSLLTINSLYAKFSRVCVMIDFIIFNEYELSGLWLLSYVYLFVVVLSRIAKGGDC